MPRRPLSKPKAMRFIAFSILLFAKFAFSQFDCDSVVSACADDSKPVQGYICDFVEAKYCGEEKRFYDEICEGQPPQNEFDSWTRIQQDDFETYTPIIRNDLGIAHCKGMYEDIWWCNCPSECFAESSQVQLADGSTVPLGNINTGDLVRTAAGVETILGFIHDVKRNHELPMYKVFLKSEDQDVRSDNHTSSDDHSKRKVIELSATHMLFLQNGITKQARDIQSGDCLARSFSSSPTGCVKVVEVRKERAKSGWRAPITSSGTIIVGGIVASVYAGVPHAAAQLFMAPIRLAGQIVNFVVEMFGFGYRYVDQPKMVLVST